MPAGIEFANEDKHRPIACPAQQTQARQGLSCFSCQSLDGLCRMKYCLGRTLDFNWTEGQPSNTFLIATLQLHFCSC
eukprot:4600042-Amphidinium_carterae.1